MIQTNPQSITVIIDGQARTMAIEAVKERFIALAREVMGADADETTAKGRHLRKQVAFGAFVIQVRPHVEGMFLRWLGEAKFGHFQKVYAAIALAEKYATADGLLDEGALRKAIERYNAGAAELGYRTLAAASLSVNAAEIAGGMRPGKPSVRSAVGSGGPESLSRVGGRMGGDSPAHAAHGGAPTNGFDSDEVDFELPTVADMLREIRDRQESGIRLTSAEMGVAAELGVEVPEDVRAVVAGALASSPETRDPNPEPRTPLARASGSLAGSLKAAEQLSFEADYAIAERMRAVAGMVEGGALTQGQRARLVALLGEIEQMNNAGALG